jgi:hypothetical protein
MPDFTFKYGPTHRYWELALAQRADLWDGPDPLMHPNPQQGYWKARLADGSWEPVVIFFKSGHSASANEDALVAQRGKRGIFPAEDAWTYCGANPISYAAYSHWWKTGMLPGEIDTPGIGHNSGETGKLTAAALLAKGKALYALGDGKTPLDQAQADALANYDTVLLRHAQALDEARKSERQSIMAVADTVNQKYMPTILELRDVREMIGKRLTSFLQMNPKLKVGGQFGKRSSLRQKRVAVIEDPVALAVYLAENEVEPFMAGLQQIANSMARSKNPEPLPGVRYEIEASVQ